VSAGPGSPFARREKSIPVTVVTGGRSVVDDLLAVPGNRQAAVIRLNPEDHGHPPGTECLVCSTRGDIRALLFDLQEAARQGLREPFSSVIVDATGVADIAPMVDRIVPGRLPAFGLRDHAVAKNFHLGSVV
jgi:hypothetical protein